jgi:hypothetical protein
MEAVGEGDDVEYEDEHMEYEGEVLQGEVLRGVVVDGEMQGMTFEVVQDEVLQGVVLHGATAREMVEQAKIIEDATARWKVLQARLHVDCDARNKALLQRNTALLQEAFDFSDLPVGKAGPESHFQLGSMKTVNTGWGWHMHMHTHTHTRTHTHTHTHTPQTPSRRQALRQPTRARFRGSATRPSCSPAARAGRTRRLRCCRAATPRLARCTSGCTTQTRWRRRKL